MDFITKVNTIVNKLSYEDFVVYALTIHLAVYFTNVIYKAYESRAKNKEQSKNIIFNITKDTDDFVFSVTRKRKWNDDLLEDSSSDDENSLIENTTETQDLRSTVEDID